MTSERVPKKTLLRRSRPLIALFSVVVLVYFLFPYEVDFVDLDRSTSPATAAYYKKLFSGEFLTSSEISDFLNDVTIIGSQDIGNPTKNAHIYINEIFYIDDGNIVNWGDTDDATTLKRGKWWLRPRIEIMYRVGDIKFKISHWLCRTGFSNASPEYPICAVVRFEPDIQRISGEPENEVCRGDPFGLGNAERPPFVLTTHTRATFAAVLEKMQHPRNE